METAPVKRKPAIAKQTRAEATAAGALDALRTLHGQVAALPAPVAPSNRTPTEPAAPRRPGLLARAARAVGTRSTEYLYEFGLVPESAMRAARGDMTVADVLSARNVRETAGWAGAKALLPAGARASRGAANAINLALPGVGPLLNVYVDTIAGKQAGRWAGEEEHGDGEDADVRENGRHRSRRERRGRARTNTTRRNHDDRDFARDLERLTADLERQHGIRMDAYPTHGGAIHLSNITVPKAQRGEGVGGRAMTALCAFADKHDRRIVLTAQSPETGGGMSRLVRFYKRFGFVENKGRNKDYLFRETMLRRPAGASDARGNPRHPSTVQSLLFARSSWSPNDARRWAAAHGFRADKVDVTANQIRLRQRDPKAFAPGRWGTVPFGGETGIQAVVAASRTTRRNPVKTAPWGGVGSPDWRTWAGADKLEWQSDGSGGHRAVAGHGTYGVQPHAGRWFAIYQASGRYGAVGLTPDGTTDARAAKQAVRKHHKGVVARSSR
jgi:GNAT superfamily N-acetyltransferase